MSRRITWLTLASAVIPSAARAAEGMPQLDFNSPLLLAQVVWLAVIFYVLYRLYASWGLPRVQAVIDARAASINGDLDAARAAKAEADAAVAAFTATTRRAQAEAMAAVNAATDTAKAEAASLAVAANRRLEAQLKAAEASIAQSRAQAMGALRIVASETAALVIDRLTGSNPDPQVLSSAIGASLAARGQA